MKKSGISIIDKLSKINKKVLILVLVAVAVVCAVVAIIVSATTKLTNESYENCAIGDINGDGFINSDDALALTAFINGNNELFDTQQQNADVNLDGKIDKADIDIIHRYSIGVIKKLPYTGETNQSPWDDGNIIESDNDGVETTIQLANYWENPDGTYSYQMNVKVANTRTTRLRNWETIITFNEKIEISKYWDCECDADGITFTAEGDSISSDSMTKFGFVIKAPKGLTVEDIVTEY